MLPRPMRTLVAILATLGLVAAISAIPAAAQTCAAAASTATELVTDDASVSFDAEFTCTDAPDSGDWSASVQVTNDSDTEVTLSTVDLARLTPAVQADAGAAADSTVVASGLPLPLAAGAAGSFDISGEYSLAQVGAGALLNVHLRATGTTGDDAPFALGINVHLLAPGVELEDADAEADVEVAAEGRPEWAPGPPPWVQVLLAGRFIDGYPWGTDDFPPVAGADVAAGASAGAGAAAAGGATVDIDPPAQVQLPAQAGAGAAAGAAAGGAAGADADSDAGADATVEISAGASGQVIVSPIGGRP